VGVQVAEVTPKRAELGGGGQSLTLAAASSYSPLRRAAPVKKKEDDKWIKYKNNYKQSVFSFRTFFIPFSCFFLIQQLA
jgi:hypothetical protein